MFTKPQVGDIWTSGNGWHVLLLKEDYVGYDEFFLLYLEDGLYSHARIDMFWTKVA